MRMIAHVWQSVPRGSVHFVSCVMVLQCKQTSSNASAFDDDDDDVGVSCCAVLIATCSSTCRPPVLDYPMGQRGCSPGPPKQRGPKAKTTHLQASRISKNYLGMTPGPPLEGKGKRRKDGKGQLGPLSDC